MIADRLFGIDIYELQKEVTLHTAADGTSTSMATGKVVRSSQKRITALLPSYDALIEAVKENQRNMKKEPAMDSIIRDFEKQANA